MKMEALKQSILYWGLDVATHTLNNYDKKEGGEWVTFSYTSRGGEGNSINKNWEEDWGYEVHCLGDPLIAQAESC